MEILYEVMDQGLIDQRGERCGRVDDIVVEDTYDRPPKVTALLSGEGAKSCLMWKPFYRLSIWLHKMLGVPEPIEPVVIPWEQVEKIEADLILKGNSEVLGLNRLNRAVAKRFFKHIPGAGE